MTHDHASAQDLARSWVPPDTPLGLKPSGCARPAGDGFRGGADTSQSGSALCERPIRPTPFWRQQDDRCARSTGERPKTTLPFERVDHKRSGAARAKATASPPHDWDSSPDACGGLCLSVARARWSNRSVAGRASFATWALLRGRGFARRGVAVGGGPPVPAGGHGALLTAPNKTYGRLAKGDQRSAGGSQHVGDAISRPSVYLWTR
jgi:hypothetical protein